LKSRTPQPEYIDHLYLGSIKLIRGCIEQHLLHLIEAGSTIVKTRIVVLIGCQQKGQIVDSEILNILMFVTCILQIDTARDFFYNQLEAGLPTNQKLAWQGFENLNT
jgi:hypothetical protein